MGSLQCHYLWLSMDAFSRMQNDGHVSQFAVPSHPDKLAKCLSVVFIQAADCNKGQRSLPHYGDFANREQMVEVGPCRAVCQRNQLIKRENQTGNNS